MGVGLRCELFRWREGRGGVRLMAVALCVWEALKELAINCRDQIVYLWCIDDGIESELRRVEAISGCPR